VDAKIPRWLRPHIPLVASDREIIWVPGLRLAEPAKLPPTSRDILEIAVTPTTPDTTRISEILRQIRK
jgi:hypothetical protein